MFADALQGISARSRLTRFVWYLERHVAVDGERHGPLAAQLFERVALGGISSAQAEALRSMLRTVYDNLEVLDKSE